MVLKWHAYARVLVLGRRNMLQVTLHARGRSYNGYPVSAGYFGSYAIDALAMALHSVYSTASFEQAIVACVNLLGDSDSTGTFAWHGVLGKASAAVMETSAS